MHAFNALMRKDLLLFLSDRRALIVNLLLPIVIASFFGYLFGGAPTSGATIDVAIVQLDSSAIGANIALGLHKNAALKVTAMPLEAARRAVRHGKQKVAVVIPAQFGAAARASLSGAGTKPAITMLYDPSQPAVLSMVKGMLTQHVMEAVSAAMFNAGEGAALTDTSLAHSGAPAVSIPFSTDDKPVGAADSLGG